MAQFSVPPYWTTYNLFYFRCSVVNFVSKDMPNNSNMTCMTVNECDAFEHWCRQTEHSFFQWKDNDVCKIQASAVTYLCTNEHNQHNPHQSPSCIRVVGLDETVHKVQ